MIYHYIKTSLKVLARRKLFTAVSLFGVGFTLIVLVVVTAMIDHLLFPTGPERNHARTLIVESMVMRSPDRGSSRSGQMGYRFLSRHVKTLPSAHRVSIFSETDSALSFVPTGKISSEMMHTDAEYWQIFEFDFIEGEAFSQQDMSAGNMVAVINQTTRRNFFGDNPALGQEINIDGQSFRVKGIVRDVPLIEYHAYSDVWVPITTYKSTTYREAMMGDFRAAILAEKSDDLATIKAEFQAMLPLIDFPDPKQYNYMNGGADTRIELLARDMFNEYDQAESSAAKLISIAIGLMVLFMSLPAINLININVSRIMERSTEIGIRKAFGASSRHLVVQFLSENMILTALGGLLGYVGAAIVLRMIESSDLIAYADFHLNFRIFIVGLGLIFIFGLLSGVYPAWKMSRLSPVQALRGGQA